MTADELEKRAELYRIYVGPPYDLMREAIARVRELEADLLRAKVTDVDHHVQASFTLANENGQLKKRIAELETALGYKNDCIDRWYQRTGRAENCAKDRKERIAELELCALTRGEARHILNVHRDLRLDSMSALDPEIAEKLERIATNG